MLFSYPSHHYQNVCDDDSDQSQYAEYLLPEYPSLLVFHSVEKKLPKWIERRLADKAIINVLVISVRLEPEFIGIVQEYHAKKEKSEDKREVRPIQLIY